MKLSQLEKEQKAGMIKLTANPIGMGPAHACEAIFPIFVLTIPKVGFKENE